MTKRFRAWDKVEKKMLHYSPFTLLVDAAEDTKIFPNSLFNNYRDFYTRYEHMQATELKDSKDEEIWQSDKFPKGGVVEWVKDGWFVVFRFKNGDWNYSIRLSEYIENDRGRKVIGNIYT